MSETTYAYGMWIVVAFNLGLFLFFVLSFLAPKGWAEWRSMSVMVAFLVALFSEMYGFPLTIYLLTSWLGDAYPVLNPFSHKLGHLWVVVLGGSDLAWALVMGVSLVLMLAGYILLSRGWRQVHGSHGRMTTDGLYTVVRHPQYTGLFLLIAGFLVQWPTLITVLMAPILLYAYVRLARQEETVMTDRFGNDYVRYAERTPRFFPPVSRWGLLFSTQVLNRRSDAGA
ncbi:methyltransferase family protein [Sedimenticola selenatireducens]|uniref:methyltransferase family protein n=1 Tax=Sedimenticola selenatireducens TaxID=191960 RepID=UPI00048C2E9C|nr:isoprenylcysteine carboxylmethyltransferase family protein [Sedimenticola selenatireducens]